jgi:hypothetical protein
MAREHISRPDFHQSNRSTADREQAADQIIHISRENVEEATPGAGVTVPPLEGDMGLAVAVAAGTVEVVDGEVEVVDGEAGVVGGEVDVTNGEDDGLVERLVGA